MYDCETKHECSLINQELSAFILRDDKSFPLKRQRLLFRLPQRSSNLKKIVTIGQGSFPSLKYTKLFLFFKLPTHCTFIIHIYVMYISSPLYIDKNFKPKLLPELIRIIHQK